GRKTKVGRKLLRFPPTRLPFNRRFSLLFVILQLLNNSFNFTLEKQDNRYVQKYINQDIGVVHYNMCWHIHSNQIDIYNGGCGNPFILYGPLVVGLGGEEGTSVFS
ncbi:hypothetical protein, partial [uncultured Prevotella sp.]|uniref:hypothetical protein n=1 Tax=uncultured Prevotella sp. TaxID=159272 RepID=UPI0025F7E018